MTSGETCVAAARGVMGGETAVDDRSGLLVGRGAGGGAG